MSTLWDLSHIQPETRIVMEGGTIPALFWNAVKARGPKVWMRQKDMGLWRSWTWDQTGQAVREIAHGLMALGFAPKDTASILSNTTIEWVLADLAVLSCGGVSNGIYPTDAASQVQYLCEDSATTVLFVEDDEQLDKALEVREALPQLRHIVVFDMEGLRDFRDPMVMSLEALRVLGRAHDAAHPGEFDARCAAARPDDLAILIYTSGTTGRPKGVKRLPATPEQMKRIEAMRAKVYGLVPGIRLIVPAPMYHAAPNVFASRGLKVADRLVLMEKFDAEELLRLIEAHRATTLVMVPTMFVRLLRLPEAVRQRYDLSSLQQVYHAAAPCPPEVKAEMIAWWGPIINEWYGTTESSVVTWCNSEQWLSHRGTVGRPIDGARVEIVGEDGALLPPGEPGEIYVGLDFYPDFTFHKREDERRQIGRNGLITGGDVGYLDQDGFLYICDRKRDMIISGGVNIYPAEIEAAILESTEVQDCAVFGVPDPEYGEAVLALVVRAPGVSEAGFDQRLRALLGQRLARYKIPRTIEIRDALPRDDAGKLIKRRLREPYWQGIERRI